MMLSKNLKYLRAQKGISQREIAADLTITRARYAKYEEALSEPPIEVLLKLCQYHQISIDTLITVDLKNLDRKTELIENS